VKRVSDLLKIRRGSVDLSTAGAHHSPDEESSHG
jgi:hypothetical protein